MGAITQPIKWHGGKHYLAAKIVALMPPHVHYVEPFAGGLSVLLAKSPDDVSEVVNDLNGDLSIFWSVLAAPELFAQFTEEVRALPFSEQVWHAAGELLASTEKRRVSRAVAFFVRCRQSLAGRMKSFTGITKTRTRRGMNNEVSAWLSAVEGLPAVHARLKRVLILNRTALDVIRSHDGPDTLFYLDPPYLHETRVTTADYAHEMTADDHRNLLGCLTGRIKGKFLLSGYRSEMYDEFAPRLGWTRTDFPTANHAAGGKSKRVMTECVWTNFNPRAT